MITFTVHRAACSSSQLPNSAIINDCVGSFPSWFDVRAFLGTVGGFDIAMYVSRMRASGSTNCTSYVWESRERRGQAGDMNWYSFTTQV